MSYRITPVRMTVRPRLWRIGATKEFVKRVGPIAFVFWQNAIIAFVRPFVQIQRKGNWHPTARQQMVDKAHEIDKKRYD